MTPSYTLALAASIWSHPGLSPCATDAGNPCWTGPIPDEAVAHALARRAEILEGEDGLPRDERPTLHPLVEAHTDFAWRLDAEEREEVKADEWRDRMIEQAVEGRR